MTTALYTRGAATAVRLLAKYGGPVTLRRVTMGTYNVSNGSATPSTADETRNGVLLDYSANMTWDSGTLVQAGDKRLLLAAGGTAPQLKDTIIAGTVTYAIVAVNELKPAATTVLYDLHLRT